MALSIPEASFLCNPATALRTLVDAVSSEERAAIRELMWHFRRDVVWGISHSRVAENVLLEAHRLLPPSDADSRASCLFEDWQQRPHPSLGPIMTRHSMLAHQT